MKVKIGKYRSRLICNLPWDNKVANWVDDKIQSVYNVFNWLYFDRRKRTVKVHIDKWDAWNADETLSYIIAPVLKELKSQKQGAPFVDAEDVPEHLIPPEGVDINDVDEHWFDRWDYVLGEMIWAFEQVHTDWEEQYYGEWVVTPGEFLGGHFEKRDYEGMQAHSARMENGFRLFGKYYQGLWS